MTPNPFPYALANKRYHTWDYHLKQKFGGKVFKVALDGGFTCPNIDGTQGTGGCTYCSCPLNRRPPTPLLEQFEAGKAALSRKWPDARQYIPYLQANTNTYAPLEVLREKYELLLAQPGVVGLALATRPDALPDPVCDYLAQLNRRTYLTVELGLQTAFDETASRINRGHNYQTFLEGWEKLSRRGIPACIHLINGLPGETSEMMIETVRRIAALRPHSVKIHLLYLIRGTRMTEEYITHPEDFHMLELEPYISTLCRQLEMLPPETIIQRVTGDGQREDLIAPLWSLKKFVVMNELDKALAAQNTWQSRLWQDSQTTGHDQKTDFLLD